VQFGIKRTPPMEEPSLIYDWNEVTQDFQWSSIESVELDDETWRDGQVPSVTIVLLGALICVTWHS